jgi:hypothetical protein
MKMCRGACKIAVDRMSLKIWFFSGNYVDFISRLNYCNNVRISFLFLGLVCGIILKSAMGFATIPGIGPTYRFSIIEFPQALSRTGKDERVLPGGEGLAPRSSSCVKLFCLNRSHSKYITFPEAQCVKISHRRPAMATQAIWGYALNANANTSNGGREQQLNAAQLNTINDLIKKLVDADYNVPQMLTLTEGALSGYSLAQQRMMLHYLYRRTEGYSRHVVEMVLGSLC